jgi:hypothetical protein
MKSTKLLLSVAALSAGLMIGGAQADTQRHVSGGPAMIAGGGKVFQWGENVAGDCHQTGATLTISPNFPLCCYFNLLIY